MNLRKAKWTSENLKPFRLNAHGMTLVEIMIVLVIVGGLMAVLVTQIVDKLGNAQVKQTKIAMGEVGKALDMFYADCGTYPKEDGLKALQAAPSYCKNWGPEPYMKNIPPDGWTNDFTYEGKGSSYVLRSLGADGSEGGEGKNKDLSYPE